MNLQGKMIGGAGAFIVMMSLASISAFAATPIQASGSTNTGKYHAQIQTLQQQIKSLEKKRSQYNQQIESYLHSHKGGKVTKNNKTALQNGENKQQKIIAIRNRLKKDTAADKSDRQAKHWSKYIVDLKRTKVDLQMLVTLKQKQLSSLQNVNNSSNSPGVSLNGTDPSAASTSNV